MAAFTWVGPAVSPMILNIGPLAVLAPRLDRLDLARIIDQFLPADPQQEFSHGDVLGLLLAARLAKPMALVNVAQWAEKSGAELLWNIPADKLNDDRLGRALDTFFEQRHAIQAAVTVHALGLAELSLDRVHFDPTHVLFEGSYPSSRPRTSALTVSPLRPSALVDPAHITHGYLAKDQKMVQVGAAAASAVLPKLQELHEALRQDLESRHVEGTADSAATGQAEFRRRCYSRQMVAWSSFIPRTAVTTSSPRMSG